MKTVLITGSEGNFGAYIVNRLRDKHPDWNLLRVRHAKMLERFDAATNCYEGNLGNPSFLNLIFHNNSIDYVIHAASRSYSHDGYRGHPFGVVDNDTSALLNVLRYSSNVSKFVYLSSALLYEHATHSPLVEDDMHLLAPTSSYGVAKYFGENAVRMFCQQTGRKFTIWRPFNIVSPLEPHVGQGRHVFVDFFRRLFIENVSEFEIIGSGNQVRCFIWVEDAAACVVDNLERFETDDQIFNLARNEPIKLIELQRLMIDIGKELNFLKSDYLPSTVQRSLFSGVEAEVRIPSVEKLKNTLNWESKTTVRDCFYKFISEKLTK